MPVMFEYEWKNTIWHRMNLVNKIVAFVTVASAVGMCFRPIYLVGLLALSLVPVLIARPSIKRWVLPLVILVILSTPGLALAIPFMTGPETFRNAFTISPQLASQYIIYFLRAGTMDVGITWGGMLWLGTMLTKTLANLFTGLVLVYTTSPDELKEFALKLRVPYKAVFIVYTAYYLFPAMFRMIGKTMDAQSLRGWKPGTWRHPIEMIKSYLPFAVPTVGSMIFLADDITMSISARAFGKHSRFSGIMRLRLKAQDYIFCAICILFFALVVYAFLFLHFGEI